MRMIFQEAVDLSKGSNFIPMRMRYSLPKDREQTSIYLISNSYEYDIELIKNMPDPKMDYKNIIIPYRIMNAINGKPFKYTISTNDYNKKVSYLNNSKIIPKINPINFPYSKEIKDNLYIPMSDVITNVTPILRQYTLDYLEDNIFDIVKKVFSFINFSKNKVVVVDTRKYKIYKNLTRDNFKSDIINALLTALMINPIEKIKRFDLTFIFRSSDMDYKVDLNTFETRDIQRMQIMLDNIGQKSEMTVNSNEEAEAVESTMFAQNNNEELDITDNNDVKQEVPIEVQNINDASDNVTSSIKENINSLFAKYKTTDNEALEDLSKDNKENDNLYNIKAIDVNATLISRITPSSTVISNYKKITDEMRSNKNDTVENRIANDAAKKMATVVAPTDENTAMNAVSSARELEIRKQVGQVKLNNITFSTLTSITDVPKPKPIKINKLSTTNPGALQGSSFTHIANEYEDKLLDRDIVATFMNFSKLPDGFYVTNVEVTDISTVTSLVNNWRVTLKNKLSDKQNVINIRVPKVINGRFYNNGIWYNIGKQDFPLPILKINKKTVMLTSNYNKITCTRYDTRSLVDLSMLTKVIDKQTDANGNNKYIKVGNSSNTNSHFVSTIEYDEFAKRWAFFRNKEANLEIYFNRIQCNKSYGFVTVQSNEFCCGMLDKVPIVVNTDTGLTRSNQTLTDLIVETLPDALKVEYKKQKPGKMSMYTEITIGVTIPAGVAIAAWEGMTSLLKKSNVKYQYVDKSFKDPKYFVIPFKDRSLAIESNVPNQLLFNGFYRINTSSYTTSEFETPIMNSNSVYVDIFNQLFFKQYSQLTTFVTYYNFFVDAITANVCEHYNMPNDIAGMLIYASNLLADNNHSSENNAALYRIRSSEIIPGIIHYRLALAISKYNNASGSKAKLNNFAFNPNEVINELLSIQNVEPMSALNPMVELHMRETITKKGFKGVNSERSYTREKRAYEDTMIGKIALSSPNSANVGIAKQLVADPKIESVRGYTKDEGVETAYNDLQLASFSELLTPGTVSRDDAIRTAIATSQTSHIVPTDGAQPALISNGVDEIVPGYLTDEFSVVAPEPGKVLEINEDYMIIQFKSGKKKAIFIGHRNSFNSGSGFYVDNKLQTNFDAGDSFVEGDILAYHEKFFSKDNDGVVRMNIGPLAKVAISGLYSTYEDAGLVTHKMSQKLRSVLSMRQEIKIDAMDDVEFVVKRGTEVEIGDPLVIFGVGDVGDKSVDNFLKAFGKTDDNSSPLDNAKRVIKAKHAGTVSDVRIYTVKSMDRLSPSLFKILDEHFKDNIKRRKILDKYDKTDSVYKMDTLFDLPTEPLKGNTIKGITCDVLVEVYISHADEASVGDKLAIYGASKQVLSEVIPEGQEPYAESRPDEEISVFVAQSSILKRMIPSLVMTASGNKVLVELKRKMREIWQQE